MPAGLEPTPEEAQHYPLLSPADKEILARIRQAESIPNLSDAERLLLSLIRTQLEEDWRQPLLDILEALLAGQAEEPASRLSRLCALAEGRFWRPSP